MKIMIPKWLSLILTTPEWVTAVATVILAISTIALVVIGYKTAESWKQQERFKAFQSYKMKLEEYKNLAFEVVTIVNTLRDAKQEYKNNAEFYNIFKSRLRDVHKNFGATSIAIKNDFFVLFMTKQTGEAVEQMFKVTVDFNNLILPIQTLNNYNEINYEEINNKYNKLVTVIDKVILEAAKSIKTKDTLKL